MLLSARRLMKMIDDGMIIGAERDAVNAASIDVRLGEDFFVEAMGDSGIVDLSRRETPRMSSLTLNGYGACLWLDPGDFVLGCTVESFNLPDNISGQFILKSSMARAGLEHSQAGWIDAGFNGSVLTLELSNLLRRGVLVLRPGMKIGQVVFWEHEVVPEAFSYRRKGNYNGDMSVNTARSA